MKKKQKPFRSILPRWNGLCAHKCTTKRDFT